MKCVICGTEYEGNECPRCNGPVIKINSSDYMARRKAYEESLARKEIQKVLDSAEEACNVLSGESEQSDKDGKTIQQGKRAKKRSNKVKNYDEGVFDITKVDFNDVADKLKAGSEKLASKAKGKAQQEKAKTRKNNNAKTDNNVKADNNIKMDSRIRPQTKHSYKKAGVAVAIVIVAIAAISLIMAVLLRKNSYIYMSDGSRIYDVSSLESQYICDVKDALFGLDEVTFYTPEWPENISKDSVVSSAASPDGKYYAADVYNDEDELYSLYVWSQDGSVEVVNNIYAHEIYYISDKGTIIYKETETINDTGKTGGLKLSMAEITNDKSSGSLIGKTDTIEASLTQAYVYSDSDTIIILDSDNRLYQYNYSNKKQTYVADNVDNIYPLSDTDGVYTKGAGHLNTSDKADEYIYNSQDNNYIVSVKNGLAQQLDGIDGANMTYIIDSKNDYIYWVGNKKVSYAKYKDGMVSDKKELGSIGNMQNIVFLKASGELVYINSEAKLINALKGDKTVIAENVKDGSLSLINNTKESITYIDNDGQYYLKTPSAKKVLMGNVTDTVNTSDTSLYRKRLYYYGSDKTLYSCDLKGGSKSQIGTVDRLWIGTH